CGLSAALAHLSTRKAGSGEGGSLAMLEGSRAPVTPPPTGNPPSRDPSQSCSLLRSILKKTPRRELVDSPEVGSVLGLKDALEYSNSATDRGGGESAAAFETLQAERTESQSSKTPKKKTVTFGEVLSPEIFDETLPANTPLRRGASPGCPQGQSPCARPGLSAEPLPCLDFGWDDEGVESLQEFLEGSVAAETPSPVENAEGAETDKPDIITRSSAKRKQCRAVAEDADCGSSAATNTENDKDTKNPRRKKIQRQKNPSTAAPK
ncbi:CDCA2 protein, partial [Lanius ludovicianus]|nr:CDCA2 protein [Lanius ludovicianus]